MGNNTMKLNSNFLKQAVLDAYTRHYGLPLEANKNKDGIPELAASNRRYHGIMHALGCMDLTPVAHDLYLKHITDYPSTFEAVATHFDISTDDLLTLIKTTTLFHDSARTADGPDLWEKESAKQCSDYLTEKGVTDDLANFLANTILNKDAPGDFSQHLQTLGLTANADYIRQLVNMADTLEILRVRPNFDSARLSIFSIAEHKILERAALESSLQTLIIQVADRIIFERRAKNSTELTQPAVNFKVTGPCDFEFHINHTELTSDRSSAAQDQAFKTYCQQNEHGQYMYNFLQVGKQEYIRLVEQYDTTDLSPEIIRINSALQRMNIAVKTVSGWRPEGWDLLVQQLKHPELTKKLRTPKGECGIITMSKDPLAMAKDDKANKKSSLFYALKKNASYVLFQDKLYYVNFRAEVTPIPYSPEYADHIKELFPTDVDSLQKTTREIAIRITEITGHSIIPTHKFHFMTGEITPYDMDHKQQAGIKRKQITHAAKTSATILSSAKSTVLFNPDKTKPVVGLAFEIDPNLDNSSQDAFDPSLAKIRALILKNGRSYYRPWVGSQAEVERYVSETTSMTSLEEYKAKIYDRVAAVNYDVDEVFIMPSKHATIAIVLGDQSAAHEESKGEIEIKARALAFQYQRSIETELGIKLPIIYYDRVNHVLIEDLERYEQVQALRAESQTVLPSMAAYLSRFGFLPAADPAVATTADSLPPPQQDPATM
jgi:hypothetical protein